MLARPGVITFMFRSPAHGPAAPSSSRHLLGLEEAVGMTVVDPVRDERGWAFRDGPGFSHDPVNGFSFLAEAYARPIQRSTAA